MKRIGREIHISSSEFIEMVKLFSTLTNFSSCYSSIEYPKEEVLSRINALRHECQETENSNVEKIIVEGSIATVYGIPVYAMEMT